jgi:UDP-2,3-diacylglucosamine pyrophosphatase LpxH
MIEIWKQGRSVKRLAFISDLHLFSNRCNAAEHLDLIARAVDIADLCVWGGDLFDFRWSRFRTESETVGRAIEWLDDWYRRFPATQFVFLDGNHDAHAPFARQLAQWADERSRFRCGLDCVRIRDTLLLHGDVIEGNGCPVAFADYRGRWQNKPVAGEMANRLYDAAVAARVHRAAAIAVHRRRATCIRLIRWMHGQPENLTRGVERIVFGHTHRRIRGYRCGGIEFHNGGAAIRHVPFTPVIIDFDHDHP